ncbi:alginate lyase family protein [Actinoplanes utahensis]|uniref:Alginate lyase domain-containing protein n=1 Tax=Actinoplanes utahensis TaxID=1869 RepID=A0A0A6X0U4_ACTUT|nr:alginate lyase family protein [Actinoplanes utahensis]KHD73647.1 hypothetical protein MB27_33260 [Actinoplanes utahensis]GIF34001.1 hypothetical protein Aut01nite_69870 [Actinoplanes utahensis]
MSLRFKAVAVGAAVALAAASWTWFTPADAPAATVAFKHPGVLLSRAQLDFVKAKVKAGAEPWKSANAAMMSSSSASLSYTPKPRATVECGSSSNPDNGCTDERRDAFAAYTHALAWYYTGDSRYAAKSIQIMDAWSGTIKQHTDSNAPLQASWAASVWPRAAEIIRHTYASWPHAGRFGTMLRTVHLPQALANRAAYNGNWQLTQLEAAVGIGVHLDDRAVYDQAVATFRKRVPAYIHLTSDGALPKPPPGTSIDTRAEIVKYWNNQTTFVDGLSQETCRDFTHTGYGIAAVSHIAETSRIQGADLYPEVQERLRHAMGLHAKHSTGALPAWLCGGALANRKLGPVTEVGFNALSNRLGIAMTNTASLTAAQRPAGNNNLMSAWETLTHAGNPA